MSVDAVSSTSSSTSTTSSSSQALSSDEFLQIMVTELTNQDPFEPMKNQDLLNQMSTIQQLQSSQNMANSFEDLMERYDDLLVRQEFGTASQMIGQLISGETQSGDFAMGKVVAVNMDDTDILLELDTGQKINILDMQRLGGSNSQDLVGEMVIGQDVDGSPVAGKVAQVEITDEGIMLYLEQVDGDGNAIQVPLQTASIINQNTADLLIGYQAETSNGTTGKVTGVKWSTEGVLLNIVDAEDVEHEEPMDTLIKIF